jgi:prolyl oligopeptidase
MPASGFWWGVVHLPDDSDMKPPLPIQERVMSGIDARPTLEAPDDDPYLWLEDIEGPRVLDWVEAQNAATLQRFNDAGVIADRDVLKAIFDRPDNIPYPNRRAGKLFNPWQDAAHPRGVWRVT